MRKYNKFSSLIIGMGFPLSQLTLLLYIPVLLLIRHSFGVTTQQILFSFSIILVGYTIGNLFWGTLSDYMGRRKALLMGLVGYLIVSFLVPLAQDYIMFLILLALHGFLAATFTSIGNAMLKDIHGHEKVARVIAFVGIAMATTPVVAPVIGSSLFHYLGWHAIYYFMGVYAIIMLLGLLVFVPPATSRNVPQQSTLIDGIKSHFTNREYMGYLISLALLFGGIMSTLEILPIIYTHYLSLSILTFGYLGLVILVPYPLGSIIASKLVDDLGTYRVMSFGVLLSILSAIVIGVLAILMIKNIVLISIVIAFLFLGFGLALSMAKAGAMISVHHHLGSASSLMKFVQSLGAMVITAINAHLHQQNAISQYTLLLCATLILSFIVLKYCVLARQKN